MRPVGAVMKPTAGERTEPAAAAVLRAPAEVRVSKDFDRLDGRGVLGALGAGDDGR